MHCEHSEDTYAMLSCRGCSTISLGHYRVWPDDWGVDRRYYPSPVSRKEPAFVRCLSGEEHHKLHHLLEEIYQAVNGGQPRLAAMGIRALLEQVMISKVGDVGTFDQKLDKLQEQEYVSLLQRDAMRVTLDLGDAAMHRSFKPRAENINDALYIVEGVLSSIFVHEDAKERLAGIVPPRLPRPPKQKS